MIITTPNARIHYEKTRAHIDEQMGIIEGLLEQHDSRSMLQPGNWSFEADLLETRQKLAEVITWLGGKWEVK